MSSLEERVAALENTVAELVKQHLTLCAAVTEYMQGESARSAIQRELFSEQLKLAKETNEKLADHADEISKDPDDWWKRGEGENPTA